MEKVIASCTFVLILVYEMKGFVVIDLHEPQFQARVIEARSKMRFLLFQQ